MKQVVLYNHNKTTYENIVRIFENDNKCAAVQPTGSGKSFLIFKLAQDNSDKTVVVFEPNKQIIGRVTEQMKEYGIDNIQFYTYQKLNSQHKRDEITIDNVDYICLDELHRIKAKQWSQAVDAIRDKFPNAKVLGLTATPERMDGQNIVDYFGAELACNITLGDAIVNKILPCPTYISALYTFDEEVQRVYDKINESRNSDEEKEEMRAELETARKQLENALGVPKILEKHIPDKNGKYIVFCQNVEHLNTIQSVIEDWFISAGFEIHTYSVHSKNLNRKTEYKEFQTDNSDCIKLCLCVDMFNEGVHLEGITGVILLRPTQSSIIYFQQIGRAISASDDNTPIIFDLVNNGNCLGSGNFKNEIEGAIGKQRYNEKQFKNRDTDIFDIGDFRIYDYVIESLNIFSNIENKCDDDFDFRLKQLEEYKAKWGHCCIMLKEAQEWDGLNEWALIQRRRFKTKKMSNERIYELDRCGFVWDNSLYIWEQNFNIVSEYICQFGTHIPFNTEYKGLNISRWVNHNKQLYRKNKLSTPQIEKLSKYDLLLCGDDVWNQKFLLVQEYLTKHNEIKPSTIFKGINIGGWCNNQNTSYHKNRLSIDRINKLKSLGLLKDENKNDKIWYCWYNILVECKNKNIKIQQNTEYKGNKIGTWVCNQKMKYKQGKLDEGKVKLIQLIYDLDYNCWNESWEKLLTILKSCIDNEINITTSTIYKNYKIGSRLSDYKKKYKQGKLSKERYQQLLNLGVDLAKKGSLM